MLRIISGLMVVVLVGLIGFRQINHKPIDARSSIDEGVKAARLQHSLSDHESDILRVQLAIINHLSKTGAPPDRLEELVPTYFDSVPKDPNTGEAIEYVRQGNSYRLGPEQAAPVEMASLGTEGEAGKQVNGDPIELLEAGEEGFVNPNTLKEEEFVYDPRGKRDPFRPFNLNLRIVNDGTMTPLEQYTLGQLRVTAIISEKSTGGTAIIEDSAGKGYPVRVGTKVGNLGGVIVSIEPDRVKILETQIDLYGKEKQNLTEMKIHLTKK